MTLQHKPQEATEMPLLGYDASRQNFIGLHKKIDPFSQKKLCSSSFTMLLRCLHNKTCHILVSCALQHYTKNFNDFKTLDTTFDRRHLTVRRMTAGPMTAGLNDSCDN